MYIVEELELHFENRQDDWMAANMDKFELAKFSFHQAGMDEGLNLQLKRLRSPLTCCFDFSGLKMWPVWAFHELQCMLLCSARKHFFTDPLSLNGLSDHFTDLCRENVCDELTKGRPQLSHHPKWKMCVESISKKLEQKNDYSWTCSPTPLVPHRERKPRLEALKP